MLKNMNYFNRELVSFNNSPPFSNSNHEKYITDKDYQSFDSITQINNVTESVQNEKIIAENEKLKEINNLLMKGCFSFAVLSLVILHCLSLYSFQNLKNRTRK